MRVYGFMQIIAISNSQNTEDVTRGFPKFKSRTCTCSCACACRVGCGVVPRQSASRSPNAIRAWLLVHLSAQGSFFERSKDPRRTLTGLYPSGPHSHNTGSTDRHRTAPFQRPTPALRGGPSSGAIDPALKSGMKLLQRASYCLRGRCGPAATSRRTARVLLDRGAHLQLLDVNG